MRERYRVKQVGSKFYPQRRIGPFWLTCYVESRLVGKVRKEFRSASEAAEYLRERFTVRIWSVAECDPDVQQALSEVEWR